jgi:PAS domain S-box-containing protein
LYLINKYSLFFQPVLSITSEEHQMHDPSKTNQELITENTLLKQRIQEFERLELERERAEDVLQKCEKKHRSIIQTAMDGFWMLDMQGRLLDVNETYARMSGYSIPELLAMSVSDLEADETAADTTAHIQKVIAHGEDRFETRHRRKDGTIFSLKVSVQYRPTDGGCLLAFLHDITERQRREIILRESEEKFWTIVDRTSDGILISDATTKKFLQGNATICSMLGYTKEEIKSLSIYDIHPPQDISHVNEELQKQIKAEKFFAEGLPVLRKDRSVFYADVGATTIAIGGRVYLVGIFHDITERLQAEQTLRQQREELSQVQRLATVGEFAASIAHEIHQPLTAILNNARAAQHFLSSDASAAIAEVRDALQDIIDDIRRAADVIHQLRSFLKKESGHYTIVDINTVIQKVITILHSELIDKKIHVTQDLSPDIPHIKCNRIELQQVLLNLILNARDSLINVELQRRHVLIQTSMDGPESVIVAVQDSGTGLDTSEIDRVFESYYTTKPNGLGMGLSLSKSIIVGHGGRIWAANNAEDGATFYFTLPVQKG